MKVLQSCLTVLLCVAVVNGIALAVEGPAGAGADVAEVSASGSVGLEMFRIWGPNGFLYCEGTGTSENCKLSLKLYAKENRADQKGKVNWIDLRSEYLDKFKVDYGFERVGFWQNAWRAMFPEARPYAVLVLPGGRNLVMNLAEPNYDAAARSITFSAVPVPEGSVDSWPLLMRFYRINWIKHPQSMTFKSWFLMIENGSIVPHNELYKGLKDSGAPTVEGLKAAVPFLGDNAASFNPIDGSPTCTRDQMTISWVNTYVEKRPDILQLTGRWNGLPLSTSDKLAIKKAFLLPCDPPIDLGNATANAPNVQRVMSILTADNYTKLVRDDVVGVFEGTSDGGNATFDKGSVTYEVFLKLIARWPYFCGEKGVYANETEACKRELSSLFAHAAQETGKKKADPPTSIAYPEWQMPLFHTREMLCYPGKCKQYDGECDAFGCDSTLVSDNTTTVHYYGRGMKQLSYAYNYAGASAAFLGDYSNLIADPDRVGKEGYLVLGSGIWFHMSPQPPKPSMHDILVGAYKPLSAAKGVNLDTDGSVLDKFAATVSAINGANECATDGSTLNPQYLQASKNRFSNYLNLLNFFGATLTTVEKAYVANTTYCTIANGPAFSDPNLSYSPNFYLDAAGGSCKAETYQEAPMLAISVEGMWDLCKTKFLTQ